jgi:hypothetical protein
MSQKETDQTPLEGKNKTAPPSNSESSFPFRSIAALMIHPEGSEHPATGVYLRPVAEEGEAKQCVLPAEVQCLSQDVSCRKAQESAYWRVRQTV